MLYSVTIFSSAKSKYLTLTFSISISSSPSLSLSGVESISSTSFPSLSLSFDISAVFIKILSDVFGSVTLNAIFISLCSGCVIVSLSKAFNKLSLFVSSC